MDVGVDGEMHGGCGVDGEMHGGCGVDGEMHVGVVLMVRCMWVWC